MSPAHFTQQQAAGHSAHGGLTQSIMILHTIYFINAVFAVGVVCMPISDQGPHIEHGWDQVVRLRHLYAARPGLHLLISGDGQIHGSAVQTLHSKYSPGDTDFSSCGDGAAWMDSSF